MCMFAYMCILYDYIYIFIMLYGYLFSFSQQCSSLLDSNNYDDFIDDLKEDYEAIREEHYDGLQEKKYVSLEEAQKRKFVIDWKNELSPGLLPNFEWIALSICK